MRVSPPRQARVAAAAIAVALTAGGTALAGDVELLDVDIDGATHLFDSYEMYPGSTSVSLVSVTNSTGGAATVSMRVVDVVSDDNGCTPPESRVDTTCGDGEGELGSDVVLTIEHDSVASRTREPAVIVERAPLSSLHDEFVLAADVGAHQTRRFRLTLELPADSGNETQSDSLEFSVEFIGEPAEVAQSAFPPAPSAVTGVGARLSTAGTLPQTGLATGPVQIVATMSVLVGTPLVVLSRRRKAAAGSSR